MSASFPPLRGGQSPDGLSPSSAATGGRGPHGASRGVGGPDTRAVRHPPTSAAFRRRRNLPPLRGGQTRWFVPLERSDRGKGPPRRQPWGRGVGHSSGRFATYLRRLPAAQEPSPTPAWGTKPRWFVPLERSDRGKGPPRRQPWGRGAGHPGGSPPPYLRRLPAAQEPSPTSWGTKPERVPSPTSWGTKPRWFVPLERSDRGKGPPRRQPWGRGTGHPGGSPPPYLRRLPAAQEPLTSARSWRRRTGRCGPRWRPRSAGRSRR
jgi:hypothetical protein